MSVHSFLTNQGQAALNAALTGGSNVVLTKFKVGTSSAVHSPTDTDLFAPVYTGTFTGKSINPIDMYLSVVECIVPYTSGGYTIKEVGLYFTQKIAGVSTDVLFAIIQYPPTPKAVGSNYPITLVIQTGNNSANSVSITVPNNQFATLNYVDIAKHAGIADMIRPMTNDNVYITPKWLETFLGSSSPFTTASAASATWAANLSSANAPAAIYIEDSSTKTISGEQKEVTRGDWLFKYEDPNTGIDTYTLFRKSDTRYQPVNAASYTVPISDLSTGVILTLTNISALTSLITLPATMSFSNGSVSVDIKAGESITITRINNTTTVAIIGTYELPPSVALPGFSNLMYSSMASISASISAAAFLTLLTSAPSGCIMVIDSAGYQTVNSENYYLGVGDIVLKDPTGFLTVQKQYYTQYIPISAVNYSMSNHEVSDGIFCTFHNTSASVSSNITLPVGFTLPDGSSTVIKLRPSATLTLFKSPGSSLVIPMCETESISPIDLPASQGSVYSMYNVTIDAGLSVGAFNLTINSIPPSTLINVAVAGVQIVGGTSYDLVVGDLIIKDNLGVYKVIQTGFEWKYVPINIDTLILSSQLMLRTSNTFENTSPNRISVTLPAGYTFSENLSYFSSTVYVLNPHESITLSLISSATKKVCIVSNVIKDFSLSAKSVTTVGGYPANGLLIYPSDRIPGKAQYLISTTPSLNFLSKESTIGRDFQGYSLLGIAQVTTGMGYPENGVLIYDRTAAIGTSALLIGDLGLCYDVDVVAGLTYNPTKLHVQEVAAGIKNTPVGGLLLCSNTASIGHGAILLGNDGLVYRITL